MQLSRLYGALTEPRRLQGSVTGPTSSHSCVQTLDSTIGAMAINVFHGQFRGRKNRRIKEKKNNVLFLVRNYNIPMITAI